MIPVVDLHKTDVTEQVGGAIEEFGFMRIRNHGVSDELLTRARRVWKEFYSAPQSVKDRYSQPPYQVGQMAYDRNAEIARSSKTPDNKEVWGLRKFPNPPLDPMTHLWVPEVPEFRDTTLELFAAFEQLTRRVMRPLSLAMGEKADWFEPHFTHSDSYMRYLHYPEAGNAAGHLDFNLLTILCAEEPGLFVKDRKGKDHAVVAEKGELILNGGMQLAVLTNNHLFPSWHWVEAKTPRDTIVFFAHPNKEMVMRPLAKYPTNARTQDHDWFPQRQPDGSYEITAGDFNARELGVIYKNAMAAKPAVA